MTIRAKFLLCLFLVCSCAGRQPARQAVDEDGPPECASASLDDDGIVTCPAHDGWADAKRKVNQVWHDPFAAGVSVVRVVDGRMEGAELVVVERSDRGERKVVVANGADALYCDPLENSVGKWWLVCEFVEFHGGIRSHYVIVRDVRSEREVELFSVDHTVAWACGDDDGPVVAIDGIELKSLKGAGGAELRAIVRFREAETEGERKRLCGAIEADDGPRSEHAPLVGPVQELKVLSLCSEKECRTHVSAGTAKWLRMQPILLMR